jgi:predicted RNA polymerase sigma factor
MQSIDRKLSVLIALTAYQIAEGKTVAEGAPVLKRLGLSASEIADVFDSTANAVNVRIAEAKKKIRSK